MDHRSFLVDASDAWAVESQTLASLAIDLVVDTAGDQNVLRWVLSKYIPGGTFVVERSYNGEEWQYYEAVSSELSPFDLELSWRDPTPYPRFTYYRVYWSRKGNFPTYSSAVRVERRGDDLGFAQAAMDWISLGPNPMQEVLNLILEVPSEEEVLLTLVDLNGRPLLQKNLSAEEARRGSQLSVSQLAPGTYVLNARQGHQQIARKLLKH